MPHNGGWTYFDEVLLTGVSVLLCMYICVCVELL